MLSATPESAQLTGLRPLTSDLCYYLAAMLPQTQEEWRLLIVAGEASGEAHAAALVRALREQAPQTRFEFFGAAGREMRVAGVEPVVASDHLAITGLLEIGSALPKFWRAYRKLKRAAAERRPHAVVLVDWPDFNLRLARSLHRQGFKIIYYISPQLWAWRAYRARAIQRDVDLLLAILPFEPEWYAARGINQVEYVGHPLAGATYARYGRAEFCARHSLNPTRTIIALLPGSRRKELERNLPPMLEAAGEIAQSQPATQFVVALAPNRSLAEAEMSVKKARANGAQPPAPTLHFVQGETYEALAAADAAAVASGTATLEAALIGTPLVVVYKESALNWHILGRLINVEHYGLVNLVAGERLAPELMQNDLTGERLAQELLALLDEQRNREIRARLREATARLSTGGASSRAAEAILRAVRDWQKR